MALVVNPYYQRTYGERGSPRRPNPLRSRSLRQELFHLSSTLNSTQQTGMVNAHASQYIKNSLSKIIVFILRLSCLVLASR